MIKAITLALSLGLCTTAALAADDDDKPSDAELAQIKSSLAELGCTDAEGYKKEEQGVYEIDDAKCKMGTVDIKLDKDFTMLLISRY